jgi:hypothetical protein
MDFVGWFLAALVHEIGHCEAALYLGSPALPAIRLDGHAAAVHGGQSWVLVCMVWIALAATAWEWRHDRVALVVFMVATLSYPVLAFTSLKETVHLVAGRVGELVFATIFFWRALAGGFIHQESERPVYASLGWFWMGQNIWLFGALMWSQQTRAWYFTNGSFGLENDFVRIARATRFSAASCSTRSSGRAGWGQRSPLIGEEAAMRHFTGGPLKAAIAIRTILRQADTVLLLCLTLAASANVRP